jgi:hypothetical protein
MNARIEKKLSKRLAWMCKTLFKNAWVLEDCGSELAEDQGSRITHCYHVGGGTDYWGEGQDAYSLWQFWLDQWPWHGDFPSYPEGHKFEHYPNTSGFNPTTKNLINLALECEIREAAKFARRAA